MSRSPVLMAPTVLVTVGLAPVLRALVHLDADSATSRMGLGLALLWLCLMAWIALSRLRAIEQPPALRDAEPGSVAAQIDRQAERLTSVSSALGVVAVPASMILAGRALLVGSRGAPALIAVVVALVSAVGLLRVVRAQTLRRRPDTPSSKEAPDADLAGAQASLFVGASVVVVLVLVGAAGLAGWTLLRLRCAPDANANEVRGDGGADGSRGLRRDPGARAPREWSAGDARGPGGRGARGAGRSAAGHRGGRGRSDAAALP